MAEYTLYTKVTCKYCTMVKRLLSKHGRTYKEVDIESLPGLRAIVKMAGFNTVPIIYTDGAFIPGGYEELLEHLEPPTDNPTD